MINNDKMKGLKHNSIKTFLVLTAAIISINTADAQTPKKDKDSEKTTEVENILKDNKFMFVAESMNPMGGRTMFLNSTYDVRITPEKVQSDLPYFGRAYVAPIDPTRSALQFTSNEYEYITKRTRKNGWDITIQPKDTREVRQMTLSISSNGNAYLQVLSNNRQPISFSGRIKDLKS